MISRVVQKKNQEIQSHFESYRDFMVSLRSQTRKTKSPAGRKFHDDQQKERFDDLLLERKAQYKMVADLVAQARQRSPTELMRV